MTGVNPKAKARKQCINNIEKALSILYQKGAAPRCKFLCRCLIFHLDIPSAEEVYEGDKYPEKVWVLLKTIFEIFAMHDVTLLLSKIVKWLNKSLSYFPGMISLRAKPEDLYHDFKNGVLWACILALYSESDETRPDFRHIY